MQQRKFIFKNDNQEIVLPITPQSFTMNKGISVETINIHAYGDINIAGNKTLANFKIDCMLPAKQYPFTISSFRAPYEIIEDLNKWIDDKIIIRFIITDTPVNIQVLIQSIDYSERDGTNDVYLTISTREYRELNAVEVTSLTTQNKSRVTASTSETKASAYLIVKGDTLSAICRKFYGNANLYPKLASYNNIKNPHLIYAGHTLQIPDISQL